MSRHGIDLAPDFLDVFVGCRKIAGRARPCDRSLDYSGVGLQAVDQVDGVVKRGRSSLGEKIPHAAPFISDLLWRECCYVRVREHCNCSGRLLLRYQTGGNELHYYEQQAYIADHENGALN